MNFGVLIGSAAASLTGLMFVVITLVSEERMRRNPNGISIFSTPTVLHFGAVLMIAAIFDAPWRQLVYPAVLLGLDGLWGVAYVLYVTHRTNHLTEYKADAEDRIWYTALPLLAYVAILCGAVLLLPLPGDALFAVGAGALLLIFIGIHNAWDIVTYVATGAVERQPENSGADQS